jgi:hypothetical protein
MLFGQLQQQWVGEVWIVSFWVLEWRGRVDDVHSLCIGLVQSHCRRDVFLSLHGVCRGLVYLLQRLVVVPAMPSGVLEQCGWVVIFFIVHRMHIRHLQSHCGCGVVICLPGLRVGGIVDSYWCVDVSSCGGQHQSVRRQLRCSWELG